MYFFVFKSSKHMLLVFVYFFIFIRAVVSQPNCPIQDGQYPVYIPDKDCGRFWQCSNGVAHLFNCSADLHFNPTLNVCDWPHSAGCLSKTDQPEKTVSTVSTKTSPDLTSTTRTSTATSVSTSTTVASNFSTTSRTPRTSISTSTTRITTTTNTDTSTLKTTTKYTTPIVTIPSITTSSYRTSSTSNNYTDITISSTPVITKTSTTTTKNIPTSTVTSSTTDSTTNTNSTITNLTTSATTNNTDESISTVTEIVDESEGASFTTSLTSDAIEEEEPTEEDTPSVKTTTEITSTTITTTTTEESNDIDDVKYICENLPLDYFFAPHPFNCSLYIACNFGNTIIMNCPFNLWFNTQRQQCLEPEFSDCRIQVPNNEIPMTEIIIDPITYTCRIYEIAFLSYPNDCSKFIVCVHGHGSVITCPKNLWFDSVSRQCVSSYKTVCKVL